MLKILLIYFIFYFEINFNCNPFYKNNYYNIPAKFRLVINDIEKYTLLSKKYRILSLFSLKHILKELH